MLLGTLGARLLGNMSAGKGFIRAGHGLKGKETIRASYGYAKRFLIPIHSLTNFEIRNYFQNEPRFNAVFSRDNLPNKIKSVAYVINLDEYSDIGTYCIGLYVLNDNVTYFDSFEVEHISKEIKKSIDKSRIITNIFRIQSYD